MKRNLHISTWLLGAAMLASCQSTLNPGFDPDDYEPILPPEPVKTYLSYASGERIVLLQDGSNAVFAWEPSEQIGKMVVRYEVLFDTLGGDFSHPLKTSKSDNSAIDASLTMSHVELNTLARMAGIKSDKEGSLKWTVRAYCGLDQTTSALTAQFSVLRMGGLDVIPDTLFLTGIGCEAATTPMQFTEISDGIFEIYAQLYAGKRIVFTGTATDNASFYYDGNKIMDGDGADDSNGLDMLTHSGVYRLTVDLGNQTLAVEEVTRFYLFYNLGGVTYDFSYAGRGRWKTAPVYIKMQYVSWGKSGETRHQFRMVRNDNTIIWGHKERDTGTPGSDLSYYNFYVSPSSDPWDYSFRYNRTLLGIPDGEGTENTWVTGSNAVTITAYFNTEFGAYTHRWTIE